MSNGGKREGAGRKPAHPLFKKALISIKLPPWLLTQLDAEPCSRAVKIEHALRQLYGWEPPDIDAMNNKK